MKFDENKHPRNEDGEFTEKDNVSRTSNEDLIINGTPQNQLTDGGGGAIMKVQAKKGAKQRAVIYASKEDGTYDPITGKTIEYNDGFQVSFVRPEAFKNLSDEQWDRLTAYIMEQTGSKEHIGVYEGVAETSFRCATIEQAREFMYLFNQDSIMDWAKRKKYPNNPNEWFDFNTEQRDTEVDYDSIMREIRKSYE
jgi:hypothetical protein